MLMELRENPLKLDIIDFLELTTIFAHIAQAAAMAIKHGDPCPVVDCPDAKTCPFHPSCQLSPEDANAAIEYLTKKAEELK